MIKKKFVLMEQQTAQRAALIQGINHVWTKNDPAESKMHQFGFHRSTGGYWHDYTRADLAALMPHVDPDEVTALFTAAKSSDWRTHGCRTRFAIPAPHYADMFVVGELRRYQTSGGEWGVDYSDTYLHIDSAMFKGKAFRPDDDCANVYESIPYISSAVAYAKANWPAYLEPGQGLGRSYIQVYLIDPSKAQDKLCSEMVLHACLNKEWHHIACTRRIPLSKAIEDATTFLSHDRLVGLQMAAGSQPDATLAICARCGYGILGGHCPECRQSIAVSERWEDAWLYSNNPPLPARYEALAIEQGHKFAPAHGPDWARKREASRHAEREKERRTAAYLRHVPAEGLPETV